MREYPQHPADAAIFRAHIKRAIQDTVGLSTVTLIDATNIVAAVVREINQESHNYKTFDEYWRSLEK